MTSHTCLFTIYIVGLKLSSAVLVGGFRAPKKQNSIFFQRAQNYMFGDFFKNLEPPRKGNLCRRCSVFMTIQPSKLPQVLLFPHNTYNAEGL